MKQKKTQFSKTLQRFDLFGERISFNIDGKDSMTTNFGSLTSLLIVSFVLFYGYRKFFVMYERQDTLQ